MQLFFAAPINMRTANIVCNSSFVSTLKGGLLQRLGPNQEWMFVTFSCVKRGGQTKEWKSETFNLYLMTFEHWVISINDLQLLVVIAHVLFV